MILALYLASPGLFGAYRSPQPQTLPVPAREIEVVLGDYYFKPQIITISVGETARLVLRNEGRVSHTFTIDELGIDVGLAPGETRTVEITPSKAASYIFYCIPHRGLGMVGNLTVVSTPTVPKY